MNSTLNRPISPTLINKCIGVALLPVAGYGAWEGAKYLTSFDLSLLGLLFVLPSLCLFTIAVFCVLFVLKAFHMEYIGKGAIAMAFIQIVCVAFLWAILAWLGGDSAVFTGDAGFAYAVISLWVLVVLYLPVLVIATVCASIGIRLLSRSAKKEQSGSAN